MRVGPLRTALTSPSAEHRLADGSSEGPPKRKVGSGMVEKVPSEAKTRAALPGGSPPADPDLLALERLVDRPAPR